MASRCSILPALLACLLFAVPVAAQTAPSDLGSTAAALHHSAIERRIAELHASLKITPDEQKPFDDFAQVTRDNGKRMDELTAKTQQGTATQDAVSQLRAYNEMAQAHSEDMQHLTTAFSALYSSLTPEQRHQADVSFRQFGKPRRGCTG